jgi:hypothetical protein
MSTGYLSATTSKTELLLIFRHTAYDNQSMNQLNSAVTKSREPLHGACQSSGVLDMGQKFVEAPKSRRTVSVRAPLKRCKTGTLRLL